MSFSFSVPSEFILRPLGTSSVTVAALCQFRVLFYFWQAQLQGLGCSTSFPLWLSGPTASREVPTQSHAPNPDRSNNLAATTSRFTRFHVQMRRLRTNTSRSTTDEISAESRTLAELKNLRQKHSVTWPKSELEAADAGTDCNDESNLLYVRINEVDNRLTEICERTLLS